MVNKLKFIVVFIFLLFSCGVVNRSSSIRIIQQQAIDDIILRKDGYYYKIYSSDVHSTIKVFFLYKNGKVLVLPTVILKEELALDEKEYTSKAFLKTINNITAPIARIMWSNFYIKHDSIGIEQILPERSYPHYLLRGHIINDTVFVITKREGIYNLDVIEPKVISLNDTFHFRKFHPKPDSLINK